jgi:integrase
MAITKCIRKSNGKKRIYYRAQVYVDGVRVGDQSFETQSAAYLWHDQEKERRESGLSNEKRLSLELTFDDCLNRYIEERFPKLEFVSQQSRNVKLPYLRNCPLSKLKMVHVNSRAVDLWINWLLKQETAKSSKRTSFFFDLKFLTTILNWYRNYLDADYAVPVTKRHREMSKYKKVRPRRPDYYARPEEVRAWIQWLKGHRNPVYFQLAAFLLLTGARIGEAAGMKWEEVDLVNHVARVVRVVAWDQRNKHPRLEERTKTDGSVRVLFLPPTLAGLMKEMNPAGDKKGLIFTNHEGEPMKYNAIQAAFNSGFKALGLPWRSTHICRHTYATMAMLATRDIASVQASLGHKTQAMTERYAKNVALLHSGTAEKTAALMNLNIS